MTGAIFDFKDVFNINKRISSSVIDIMGTWLETYKSKNSNYGSSWLLTGQTMALWFPKGIKVDSARKFVMLGLTVRMLDKLIRAAHLELTSEEDKVGERSSETYGDLGVYGFMAAAAARGELKKSEG